MRKTMTIWIAMLLSAASIHAQGTTTADDVLATLQRANDYFMAKYADPTRATYVKKVRPSSLWTRAVYYEGLMALNDVDPQQRYRDYVDRWAEFHQWTPRDGVNTCDADNQCCAQTYLMRFMQVGGEEKLLPTRQNLDHQLLTPNLKLVPKNEWETAKANAENLYGWWTWIDAIQMAMPVYAQMTAITGEKKYFEHAMKMYCWTRDTLAGGLFNEKEGLWWRDKDFVPPYQEPDGRQCYWSRGNGWVYAALVRVMESLTPIPSPKGEGGAKVQGAKVQGSNALRAFNGSSLLRKDFIKMSKALLQCQREDGLWDVSLVSSNYEGKELTGTSLFLYGLSWGIRNGLLPAKKYRAACDRAWQALQHDCVHADGFLGWVQGTGKEPKDGQPLSYTRVPDFEDFGTGCFLLGGSEYYKLLKQGVTK